MPLGRGRDWSRPTRTRDWGMGGGALLVRMDASNPSAARAAAGVRYFFLRASSRAFIAVSWTSPALATHSRSNPQLPAYLPNQQQRQALPGRSWPDSGHASD